MIGGLCAPIRRRPARLRRDRERIGATMVGICAKVVVTIDERDAICKRYGITYYDLPNGPIGSGCIYRVKPLIYTEVHDIDNMTPGEFESLVLAEVIEKTFTP